MPACKLRSVSKSNDRISGSRACSTMWKYLFAMYRYTLFVYVCLCVYRFYNAILFFVNMLPSEIYPAILYWTSWKQVVENNCGNIGMTDQLFTMHVTQLLQYRTTRGNRCLVCIVEFLWQTWGSISEFIFERAQLFRCCGSPRVRDARPGMAGGEPPGPWWTPFALTANSVHVSPGNQGQFARIYRFPTIPPQISMGHQVSTHGNPFRLRHMAGIQAAQHAACGDPVTGEKGPLLRRMWLVLQSFRSDCQT